MSTELTREQACDKFIAQKMRDGAGGLNRIISRAAFEAGWSARDAEVARLRAAIAKTVKRFDEAKATYMPRPINQDEFADELRAILEPTK